MLSLGAQEFSALRDMVFVLNSVIDVLVDEKGQTLLKGSAATML